MEESSVANSQNLSKVMNIKQFITKNHILEREGTTITTNKVLQISPDKDMKTPFLGSKELSIDMEFEKVGSEGEQS